MPSPRLSADEIERRAATLPDWIVENGDTLRRDFTFPDFVAAMRFVNLLAENAEAVQHHPDLDIRYNRVTVRFSTHDSGGLTKKDFDQAKQTDTAATET